MMPGPSSVQRGFSTHSTRPDPTSYSIDLAVEQGAGDQCTNGLNFHTLRPRRDVLADYKAIVQRIYQPAAYYGRVRAVARSLDRPALDWSATWTLRQLAWPVLIGEIWCCCGDSFGALFCASPRHFRIFAKYSL